MMTNYHQKSLPKTKFCFFRFSGNYRGHFPEFTVRKSTGIPEFRYSGINPYSPLSPCFDDVPYEKCSEINKNNGIEHA